MWIAVILILAATVADAKKVRISDTPARYLRFNSSSKAYKFSDLTEDGGVAATAYFAETYEQDGWDTLHIMASNELLAAHPLQAYHAVGYAEGFLTYKRLWCFYYNAWVASPPQVPKVVLDWVNDHYKFMMSLDPSVSLFNAQVRNILSQLEGLHAGYSAAQAATGHGQPLSFMDIFLLNFGSELGDVADSYRVTLQGRLGELSRDDEHCSGLIKVTKDDVFLSQVTWSGYDTMMRHFKTYTFGPKTVVLSGYPGYLASADDWYITSHRLAVMETTYGVSNPEIFRKYVRDNNHTVSEWIRVMAANFIAEDAVAWVGNFSLFNSGTYNNQWLAFDMKKFTPGKPLPPNSFWLAEQIPGLVESKDMTPWLNQYSYFGSYNTAYFDNIFNISGGWDAVKNRGDYFHYSNSTRAKMFARNHTNVVDMATMKALMRYNNYKHDPLSLIPYCDHCDPPYNAYFGIACRGDLCPRGNVTTLGPLWGMIQLRNHGTTDAKIAAWSMMREGDQLTSVVISGPNNDQCPTFRWSTSPWANNNKTPSRVGLVDTYDFPWMEYTVDLTPKKDDDTKSVTWIVVGCIVGAICLVVVIVEVIRFNRRSSEPQYHPINTAKDGSA